MSKIKFAALSAIVLAVAAISAFAQATPQQTTPPAGAAGTIPDGKVAVINTTAFPAQIGELKQKYDQVDNQFKDRSQKIQAQQTQLTQLENNIRTQASTLTQERLQQMQDEYQRGKKNLERDLEDARADYDKAVDAATKPVRDKLFQYLQKYAQQRGIVVVFNLAGAAQTGSLAYWNPGTDITQDFINEYNRANPVPTAAPAPQSAAPKTPGKPNN
ncbi:MAG TPA: OmpH family outer membrane protein [Blastocatellia bacterium]|nr:OmpH family outer membrane protein [Blastocatellia bacterium]